MLTSSRVGKVNVLFIIMQMEMGGSERLVLNLASKLDREVFNPSVAWFFGDTPLQEYLDLAIPLYHIPKYKRFDFAAMRLLGRVMEENGIDIVNAHHFMSMVYAFYGCKLRRHASLIYTEHSEWELERISKKWRVMGGPLLKQIDRAVGVSPAVTSTLKRVLRVRDGKASTIINGVDVDKFKNSARNITDIKRRLNVRDGEAIIGTVGNLKTIKNHIFLVQAFSEVKKILRNVRLLIIGQGMLGAPDNSERALTERVQELGITDRVSLLGYRADIPDLLSIMHVFCLTSLKEGLPISLIEAMAAGLPVVGTNVEGIRDVIVPREDGLLVELGDVEALKKALIDLLTKPAWSYKLGEAARRKAEEKYSLKRCVSEYEALFLSASNRNT